jgi:hypothetical protein
LGFLPEGSDFVSDLREVSLFHSLDEEDSVEMVYFMLDAPGEQTVAFENVRDSVEVLIFNSDEFGAGDVTLDSWQREATFLIVEFIAGKKFDFRVSQWHGHKKGRGERLSVKGAGNRVIRMIGNLDYAKAQGLSDLLCCKAYAFGVSHCLRHVVGQLG